MAKENQLQLEFTKTAEQQNKLTVAKSKLKLILEDMPEYIQLTEQKKEIEEKLKAILTFTGDKYPDLLNEIAVLKMHLKGDKEKLGDIAINQLMSGETVEVFNENNERLEPTFKVTFKKA